MTTPENTKIGNSLILAGRTVGGEVGTFGVDFVIWNRDETVSRTLNGLVDTGSTYSVVPETVLDELGIERRRYMRFGLADGSRRDLAIGRVQMELTDQVEVEFR